MTEHRDLPFYDGRPVEISARGWLVVLLGVVVGFAALVALPLRDAPLNFLPSILFVAIPLGALAMVVGPHWRALFHRYGIKQFGQSLGFGLLTIVVSFIAGLLLSLVVPVAANPVFDTLSALGPAGIAAFLARTFIQLVGEELTPMLPLLAVLWLCVSRFGLSKRTGIIIAVVVSTLWFAALHLPTYNWNIIQCLGIIGTARVVLTLSYLVTRNLWVSAGAHIINDWTLSFVSVAGSHTPIGT
jgi:membrane protease YdiL (CAAX protease family)